jgi:hypothetical protein
VKDVGGIENFMNDVEKYLALGGGEWDGRDRTRHDRADQGLPPRT